MKCFILWQRTVMMLQTVHRRSDHKLCYLFAAETVNAYSYLSLLHIFKIINNMSIFFLKFRKENAVESRFADA